VALAYIAARRKAPLSIFYFNMESRSFPSHTTKRKTLCRTKTLNYATANRVVNTVRYQLKQKGINSGWREIVRIMNTQKAVTTLAQNHVEEVIKIRRCSDPNQKVIIIYDALKYKYAPFKKKKSVVHKSELED